MEHKVISKQVAGLAFSFYSPEEIKRLSVKQITLPESFDKEGQPVPYGLYDPALGPLDFHAK